MFRRVLARLVPGFGGGEENAEAEGERSESGRFVPSRLDRSVRVAHGDASPEIERELAAVEAKARILDDEGPN